MQVPDARRADKPLTDSSESPLLDPIQLLLIEPDAWARQALVAHFEGVTDIKVVGALASSKQLSTLGGGAFGHVVLLSISRIDQDTLAVVEQLCRAPKKVPVVVFTNTCDPATMLAARVHGVNCYLIRTDEQDLVAAVRTAAAGGVLLSATAARAADVLLRQVAEQHSLVPNPCLDGLSTQQRKVLGLLAQGRPNAAIAVELCLTERTIKWHVSKLLARFGFSDRGRLIAFAHSNGVFTPPLDAG